MSGGENKLCLQQCVRDVSVLGATCEIFLNVPDMKGGLVGQLSPLICILELRWTNFGMLPSIMDWFPKFVKHHLHRTSNIDLYFDDCVHEWQRCGIDTFCLNIYLRMSA